MPDPLKRSRTNLKIYINARCLIQLRKTDRKFLTMLTPLLVGSTTSRRRISHPYQWATKVFLGKMRVECMPKSPKIRKLSNDLDIKVWWEPQKLLHLRTLFILQDLCLRRSRPNHLTHQLPVSLSKITLSLFNNLHLNSQTTSTKLLEIWTLKIF